MAIVMEFKAIVLLEEVTVGASLKGWAEAVS
jgi:hypothetical protein